MSEGEDNDRSREGSRPGEAEPTDGWRASLAVDAQSISVIGLPMVAVPLKLSVSPIGVQLIGRPWSAPSLLRVARRLNSADATQAPIAGSI